MGYQPKSYRRFLASTVASTVAKSATLVECVSCSKEINISNDEYNVGESLGEYWCKECSEVEQSYASEGQDVE
jgi:hypothetical protein